MRLSTKGRYSARAMLDLALNYGHGPITLKEVSRRQDISEGYLENIITSLVAHGLVASFRGKSGGFVLSKPPQQICLGDVIRICEGSLALVRCVDDPAICKRSSKCVTIEIWTRLKNAMTDVLNDITLQDMVEMHQRKTSDKASLMYYI